MRATQLVHLLRVLLAPHLEQLRLQHLHRAGAVLDLAALVLAGDDDAGRKVRDPNGGVRCVDTLPARPAGPVDIDADVLVRDVYVVGLLDYWGDVDVGERRLPPRLVVERRDPHQPAPTVLTGERAVGEWCLHDERRGLDAGFLGVRRVVDLGRVAVPLRPSLVHPHQHLRPVGSVGAAGAGVDRDQRLTCVVLAGQQRPHLERLDVGGKCRKVASGLLQQRLVIEIDGGLQVVKTRPQRLDPVEVAAQVRHPAGHALRALLVVPQLRVRGLVLQLRELLAHRVEVEDNLH